MRHRAPPPGFTVRLREARSRAYKVVISPDGSTFPSVAAAWRSLPRSESLLPCNLPCHSPPRVALPKPKQSPGMVQLAEEFPTTDFSHLASRASVLSAPVGTLGPNTEAVRHAAVDSVLARPFSAPVQPSLEASHTPATAHEPLVDATPKAVASAKRLIKNLPLSCFVEMAGGQAAYDRTPPSERQLANLRTVCKAVGRNGDTGDRLSSYIEKLKAYRRIRDIQGELWPLYPCVLANFAVWLQITSPKDDATSVAPRCISAFVSASASLKLPVFIDSPHLGAVPAHQVSGDGWTGHLPLDIAHELEDLTNRSQPFSQALDFDAKCAYTIWAGSCRVQDWVETMPTSKTMAPGSDAVYKIKVTKNGERGTLFALGADGINSRISWRESFACSLQEYGPAPAASKSDTADPACTLLRGTKLDAKAFAKRIFKVILFCAKRRGYTASQLKELHVSAHSLHGSFAAYAEALEWDTVPQHKLGRWKLPASVTLVRP